MTLSRTPFPGSLSLHDGPLILQDDDIALLIGPTGSGKSRLAERLFRPDEILPADALAAAQSQDTAIDRRIRDGKIAAIEIPGIRQTVRIQALHAARGSRVHAVVLAIDPQVCAGRIIANGGTPEQAQRAMRQADQLISQQRTLLAEGYATVTVLRSPNEADALMLARQDSDGVSWRNLGTGAVDVIGDVHGCAGELIDLLDALGHRTGAYDPRSDDPVPFMPAPGRRVLLLGDLVDRGPDSTGVLRIAMGIARSGHGGIVLGNHDFKLARALSGRAVKRVHGLAGTMADLERRDPAFRTSVLAFLSGLPLTLPIALTGRPDGLRRAWGVHAALPASLQPDALTGRTINGIRETAIFGVTTGRKDPDGFPERLDWAQTYDGDALVVHGHTPMQKPRLLRRVACIDTGCAFGGALSALRLDRLDLRHPDSLETALVTVPARRAYTPGRMDRDG